MITLASTTTGHEMAARADLRERLTAAIRARDNAQTAVDALTAEALEWWPNHAIGISVAATWRARRLAPQATAVPDEPAGSAVTR